MLHLADAAYLHFAPSPLRKRKQQQAEL